MSLTPHQVQQAAGDTAWAGAATGIIGVLTSSYFIGLLGVAVAFLGVVINSAMNWHFRRREDMRRQAEHEKAMRRPTIPGSLE
jgi:hypothetical protein